MDQKAEHGLVKGGGSRELGRGASVGRYLIVGLVGRGGMGEVYAAYDPELDRKIALKLLRARATPDVDGSDGRARLLREAQAIARLSDPNVVVMYDVGTFEDRVFLAMEFVDGNTVGYWLQAQARPWRDVVKTFIAAGRGLASAHRAGIVHRDFKPDNVMIGRDGKVRVMDFGLARTVEADGVPETNAAADGAAVVGKRSTAERVPTVGLDAGGSRPRSIALAPTHVSVPEAGRWTEDDTSTRDLSQDAVPIRPEAAGSLFNAPLTVTGAMMGTPAYMAPEQFQGGTIDERTDQFSFCVSLYEGLYGERPFAGKSLQELSAHVSAGLVRPAPATARVPRWLRKVLLRGLRVRRDDRYASMEMLLTALDRDPVRSRRRWAATASVAALVGVLSVGLVQSRREQRMRCLGADAKLAGIWELPTGAGLSPRKEAIRRAFLATGKRYAAESFVFVTNALDRYVSEWTDMHRDACEATNIRGEQSPEVLDLRMACLNDRLSEVRSLTAVFSEPDGEVVSKSVEASQSLRSVQQCADIVALRAVVRPPDDPAVRRAVADVRTGIADVKALTDVGGFKKAEEQIGAIVEMARATNYPPVVAEALARLGALQETRGDRPGAEQSYEEAVWLAEASRHDEIAAESAAQLIGIVGTDRNRENEAERWARHATSVLMRLGPGHDVLAGWAANNLAGVYLSHDKNSEALAAFQRALKLKMTALGETHLEVALTYANLALVLAALNRLDEALDRNNKALAIFKKTIGAGNRYYANALSNGAEFNIAAKRFRYAEDMARVALSTFEDQLGQDHPFLAYALTCLGTSLVEQGKIAEGIVHLRRALLIRENAHEDRVLIGETRFALARAESVRGERVEWVGSLLHQAREDFASSAGGERRVAEIDAWSASHASAQPSRVSMR